MVMGPGAVGMASTPEVVGQGVAALSCALSLVAVSPVATSSVTASRVAASATKPSVDASGPPAAPAPGA